MRSNRQTVYLSGPITGMPENNYREFKLAEERINAMGFETLVPHDFFFGIDTREFKHNDYMRECIKQMMDADIVVTLKDWEQSKDCKMEVTIAREMDIPVQHIISFLNGKS